MCSDYTSGSVFYGTPGIVFANVPSYVHPASISSVLPQGVESFVLTAITVIIPSLGILLVVARLPTFANASGVGPSVMSQVEMLLGRTLFLIVPSLAVSELSLTIYGSSHTYFATASLFSCSSLLVDLLSGDFFVQTGSISPYLTLVSTDLAQLSTRFDYPDSKVAFALTVASPFFVFYPTSLCASSVVPRVYNLVEVSSHNSVFPMTAIIFFESIVSTFGVMCALTLNYSF